MRVIVPLLGGGFGAKCDFHFEGHVAALARAAGRPVKLVFSRQEEFVAVGHRREGMVIELETGARADGTLVARRARLVLDRGAYCGEGGFFAQMAAMHAAGPYVIENVKIESYLNYSNTQPSSSIRAPTAPQVCWALEQHMDELAEALAIDPVDLRCRTLIEDGAEGPTRQVFDHVGIRETFERAVELVGDGPTKSSPRRRLTPRSTQHVDPNLPRERGEPTSWAGDDACGDVARRHAAVRVLPAHEPGSRLEALSTSW